VTVVVSDTSPLNYLLLCNAADLLPNLFGEVVVPPAVLTELRDDGAPDVVRNWANALPAWATVRSPTKIDEQLKLDPGEREAICLALEINADLVLVDETAGRLAAKQRGLNVIGTLGVLARAAENGLVDLPTIVSALTKTTFQIDPKLIREVLEQDARRRGK
jgi:predicted nucleic acid-binding protein